MFLPITKNSHAFVLGLTASMCYLATLSIITHQTSKTSDYVTKVNPMPTMPRCNRADTNRASDCSSKSAAKNGLLFFLLFPLQSQIVSDVIYFVCVNSLGLYFRFMNEVVIRRSFLDRRKCVESTLRLNYEKDQEVGLNEHNWIIATRSSRLSD